jgi:transposase-like protein
MCSYEDRIKAVKLYIKLGKCIGATIRQLGYPTKNAPKSWHREFEQGRDLPVGYARSKLAGLRCTFFDAIECNSQTARRLAGEVGKAW